MDDGDDDVDNIKGDMEGQVGGGGEREAAEGRGLRDANDNRPRVHSDRLKRLIDGIGGRISSDPVVWECAEQLAAARGDLPGWKLALERRCRAIAVTHPKWHVAGDGGDSRGRQDLCSAHARLAELLLKE